MIANSREVLRAPPSSATPADPADQGARPTPRSRGPGPRQRRPGRLALSALFSTVLTALVLAAPVLSGATGAPGATPFVARESVTATGAARTTSR